MTSKTLFSLAGIVVISALSIAYLTFGVIRVDPFEHHLRATLVLPNSTGLQTGSPILLTGVKVGKVSQIRRSAGRVDVDFDIDTRYRVAADSTVTVEALSALGEPYIEFGPNTDGGPYLRDGQILQGDKVHAPLSIAQAAHLITQVMDQLDPQAMSGLVDTANTALTGTDSIVPGLARSSNLLAAMLMSRSPKIGQLLTGLQSIAPDMDWSAPAFEAATPTFVQFGQRVNEIVAAVERLIKTGDTPAMYQQGNGLVPFLEKLTAWIDKAGPDIAPLAPAIQPLADTAVSSIPRLDLSALIAEGAQASNPPGSLHLRVNVK